MNDSLLQAVAFVEVMLSGDREAMDALTAGSDGDDLNDAVQFVKTLVLTDLDRDLVMQSLAAIRAKVLRGEL